MSKVVIMFPAYNAAPYLKKAIESIKKQTFQDFVCNVVNDGSKDNTLEEILKNIQGDSRFNLISLGKNMRLANARNISARLTDSEYIAALDADDEWLEDHLEKRVKHMKEKNVDFLYGDMIVNGNILVPDKNDKTKKLHILNETSQGATIFVKRNVFEAVNGYRDMYGEDGDLLERVLEKGFKVEKVSYKTYIYNQGVPGSLTSLNDMSRKNND